MNASMWKKIWGDIRTRKGRTILVATSIFIGVMGVVTLISAGDILVTQRREDIQEDELAMVSTFLSLPNDAVDELDNGAVLETLEAYPGVTSIQGEASYDFFWHDDNETRFRESSLNAYTEPLDSLSIQPMRLVEGEFPVAGESQLVVEQRMATDFDLDVGDTIVVRVLEADTEGRFPEETWTISGIVFHPYNEASSETMYTTLADAQRVAGTQRLTSIYARFEDYSAAEAARDDFTATLNDQTPYIAVFTLAEDPAENSAIQTTEEFAQILAVLAVIAMLVSGFLVVNVVSNIVVEQRKQIGVMKSLGASRAETFGMYAGIAMIYGVLGMIPGVLLGIPLGYQLSIMIGDLANTLIDDFAISGRAIALGTLLGIAVPVLAASIPVRSGTKVSILEAMTDLGISSSRKVGPLVRMIRGLPLPLNIKQTLSNLLNKKGRLALTVSTLTMAVAAFMGVTAVFLSVDRETQAILSTFQFDVSVQPTNTQDFDTVRNLLVENVDGVEEVYPGATTSAQVQGYISETNGTNQIVIFGIDPAAPLLDLRSEGTMLWDEDPTAEGIVLTNEVANGTGVSVGDTVTVSIQGSLDELEVIGIASFPFPLAFMQWEQVASLAGLVEGAPQPNSYFTALSTDATALGQVPAWGIDEQTAAIIGAGASLDDGVFISEALANTSNLDVGDNVTLAGESFTVNAIFSPPAERSEQGVPEQLVAMDWQNLASLEGIGLDGSPIPNAFLVTSTADDPSAHDVDLMIEDINEVLVAAGISASFTNQVDISEQTSELILSVGIVLNIASGVMAGVGAIGLVTTLAISVFERQKEIGVMRSTGAKSPVIIIQFLVEGIVVGIIAWIIGIPLSVVIALILNNMLPFGDFIAFSYSPLMPLVGLIGILIIATLASMGPSVSASRKTVSEILRYQ